MVLGNARETERTKAPGAPLTGGFALAIMQLPSLFPCFWMPGITREPACHPVWWLSSYLDFLFKEEAYCKRDTQMLRKCTSIICTYQSNSSLKTKKKPIAAWSRGIKESLGRRWELFKSILISAYRLQKILLPQIKSSLFWKYINQIFKNHFWI